MDTINDLSTQIRSLRSQILEIDGSDIFGLEDTESYRVENERIERYLSEFTSRQGVLLTIAGLLTLLPLSEKHQINYLLLWSVPFLICAICSYILSAKRVNFISPADIFPLDQKAVNNKLKNIYFKSIKFYRAADCFIVMFFVSFVTNFYILSFYYDICLLSSFFVLISALFLGLARYIHVAEPFIDKKANEVGTGGLVGMYPMTPNLDK